MRLRVVTSPLAADAAAAATSPDAVISFTQLFEAFARRRRLHYCHRLDVNFFFSALFFFLFLSPNFLRFIAPCTR